MRNVFFLIALIFSPYCYSEYRVYQYLVQPQGNLPQDNKPYVVTSSLFPSAYLAYHGGSTSIRLDLLKSWHCPGYTGDFKKICPSPYKSLEIEMNKSEQP